MTTTGRTILGVFDEPAMADQAIDALQTANFIFTTTRMITFIPTA